MAQAIQSKSWMRFAAAFAALLMNAGLAQAEVSITNHATENMACSAGVCSPTAKRAYLSIRDLQKLLKRSDITVTTGSGAVTMGVDAPLSWTSKSRLTLNAIYNVAIKAPLTVAGPGALTIVYNSAGTDGDLKFFPAGRIDFWDISSALSINGEPYTLVGDIATLAKDIAGNGSGRYALAADYDASADGTYSQPPIGLDFVSGTFEGLGHTISNLEIDSNTSPTGFFAYLIGDTVRDFGLINAQVHAFGDAGLLVGSLETESLVTACYSTGSISGAKHAGGLVGVQESDAPIRRSHSDADVSGELTAGGLVGSMEFSSIDGSYATGRVTADAAKVSGGGLVGFAYQGHISNSYATGPVVSGGGRSLRNLAEDPHRRPAPDDGGLIGTNSGTLTASYATGSITSAKRPAGGLIGSDNAEAGSLSNTYWDLDTSGVSNPAQGAGNIRNDPGITGLTDAQLKSALPAGFDPAIWGQNSSINNGYPYLLANPPPQGTKASTQPTK